MSPEIYFKIYSVEFTNFRPDRQFSLRMRITLRQAIFASNTNWSGQALSIARPSITTSNQLSVATAGSLSSSAL
jgi:hypothetical protein